MALYIGSDFDRLAEVLVSERLPLYTRIDGLPGNHKLDKKQFIEFLKTTMTYRDSVIMISRQDEPRRMQMAIFKGLEDDE